MRKTLLGLTLAGALGCGDHNVEIARQLYQIDPTGGPPSVLMVADCQTYGSLEMDRACVVDSDGQSYSLAASGDTGRMIVSSLTPPYGVYFLFTDRYTPLAADISTTGEDASVQVYAAPYNVQSSPCCSESDQANRIAARASLTPEGGLLVTVHDALPSGTQVAVILTYSALYRSRITPAGGGSCDLPDDLCATVAARGWAARFYVGASPVQATADGTTPQGGSASQGAGK